MFKPILISAVLLLVGVPASARFQVDTVMNTQLLISANGKEMTATFADNSSADAFRNLIAEAPLTVAMDDYGGFEKVRSLGYTLPANDTRITTVTGDIMLYIGSEITIFYGSNTWSYTRLGKIDGNPTRESIISVLGTGNSNVTFSLKAKGVDKVYADNAVLQVSVSGRTVRVENRACDAVISAYDAGGGLIYRGVDDIVELPAAGVYIIESGSAKAKVMVK